MTDICDFCSSTAVAWDYPAQDFSVDADIGNDHKTLVSQGGWLACEVCHGCIEAGENVKLSTYSAHTHPDFGKFSFFELYDALRTIHDAFRAHRQGPCEPYTPEEKTQ